MGVRPDLICFAHLRWDFVTQRPNHLMTRAARGRRVFFVEEPFEADAPEGVITWNDGGVQVVRPIVPLGATAGPMHDRLRTTLDLLVEREEIVRPVRWYYTAMALPWSDHVPASAVVYDCMDELSAFRGAPRQLVRLEESLLATADLVFTGGRELWLAKRDRHPRVHSFPSSVDAAHFRRARDPQAEPAELAGVPHPRIGWFGVIDERLDLDLLDRLSARRPDWHFVLVGPIAKIEPDDLPARSNVHHLGPRPYGELPAHLAAWDVAMMPFALNDATRYISPTKTPEYLAAGRPVVSTAIRDVVEPYGRLGLVRIADDAAGWEAAIEAALADDLATHRDRADAFLATHSWDRTWAEMDALLASVERQPVQQSVAPATRAAPPLTTRPRTGARATSFDRQRRRTARPEVGLEP
ncbi:MAG: glycosyltransferase [Chloroflexota bacterium]